MEVKSSLSDYILKRYTPDPALKDKTQLRIYDALKNNDLDALNREHEKPGLSIVSASVAGASKVRPYILYPELDL